MSKEIVHNYKEADLKVGELTLDPRVQRTRLKEAKVRNIYRNFNPAALQIITVSLRKDLSYVVLDGMHRVEAVRRLTDNTGTVPCHVLEGLTLAQEAEIFLALNYSDKPHVIDRYRISVVAEDVTDTAIDELVHAYGYTVSDQTANGHINAVVALRQLHELSLKIEAEPSLVQATLLVVSKAWGNDRHGTQSSVLLGIGRVIAEYGSALDLDHLAQKLSSYRGGPQGLVTTARAMSTLRRTRVAMGIAELIVDEYNKGKHTGSAKALHSWRQRV